MAINSIRKCVIFALTHRKLFLLSINIILVVLNNLNTAELSTAMIPFATKEIEGTKSLWAYVMKLLEPTPKTVTTERIISVQFYGMASFQYVIRTNTSSWINGYVSMWYDWNTSSIIGSDTLEVSSHPVQHEQTLALVDQVSGTGHGALTALPIENMNWLDTGHDDTMTRTDTTNWDNYDCNWKQCNWIEMK